jgi:REP-associated tyrosine transposase
MGRAPRIINSALQYHVIVRCNDGAFLLETAEDFSIYLSLLRLAKRKHSLTLFNYELMNSHVHLFLQPGLQFPFYKVMQLINWKYAIGYNLRKGRKGHFWMSRYQCIPVESDRYGLSLMRYINRNPLRARMVEKAEDWPWSAYRFYAFGEANDLITPHITYLALSSQDEKRQEEYRNFVNDVLPSEDRRDLFLSEGPFIGSEEFGKRMGLGGI